MRHQSHSLWGPCWNLPLMLPVLNLQLLYSHFASPEHYYGSGQGAANTILALCFYYSTRFLPTGVPQACSPPVISSRYCTLCFMSSATPLPVRPFHLSYEANIAWQHWLHSFQQSRFFKLIISCQIVQFPHILGVKAYGAALGFPFLRLSSYHLLTAIADARCSYTVLFFALYSAVLCTSESQPCSHCSPWLSYPWRCSCYRSTLLQEHTDSSHLWEIRALGDTVCTQSSSVGL